MTRLASGPTLRALLLAVAIFAGWHEREAAAPAAGTTQDQGVLATLASVQRVLPDSELYQLIGDVRTEWQRVHAAFIDERLVDSLYNEFKAFESLACATSTGDVSGVCADLLKNREKVAAIVQHHLDDVLMEDQRPKVRALSTWLAAAIGHRWTDYGYPDDIDRPCHRALLDSPDTPRMYEVVDTQVLTATGRVFVCSPATFVKVAASGAMAVVEASLTEHGLSISPRPLHTPIVERVIKPIRGQPCDDIGQVATTEVTRPMVRGDTGRHIETRPFSTKTVLRIHVNDPGALCAGVCRELLERLAAQASLSWRMYCQWCDANHFLMVMVADATYVDLLNLSWRSREVTSEFPGPTPSQVVWNLVAKAPKGPYTLVERGTSVYNGLCGDEARPDLKNISPNLKSILCGLGLADCPSCVDLTIDLDPTHLSCGVATDKNLIACASDQAIQLNTQENVFVGLHYATVGPNGVVDQRLRIGSGNNEVMLETVLLHELGHLFGLPHVQAERLDTRRNVMDGHYSPLGSCLATVNVNMLNRAVDKSWPFTVRPCEGLRR